MHNLYRETLFNNDLSINGTLCNLQFQKCNRNYIIIIFLIMRLQNCYKLHDNLFCKAIHGSFCWTSSILSINFYQFLHLFLFQLIVQFDIFFLSFSAKLWFLLLFFWKTDSCGFFVIKMRFLLYSWRHNRRLSSEYALTCEGSGVITRH